MELKLVSCIIPTYNRKDLIVEALDSVYSQTYRPIEVIVVDDGSTDNTAETVQHWGQVHSFDSGFSLTYIKQANSGASSARNFGLQNAKGEYIQFLDSDDLLSPDKFELQIELLRKTSANFSVCYGQRFIVDIYDKSLHNIWNEELSGTSLIHFAEKCQWPSLAPLYRRDVINQIGDWNIELKCLEDWEYGVRLSCLELSYCICDKILCYVREHSAERLSGQNPLVIADNYMFAISNLLKKVNLKDSDFVLNGLSKKAFAAARIYYKHGRMKQANQSLKISLSIARSHRLRLIVIAYFFGRIVLGDKLLAYCKNLVRGGEK